MFDFVRLGPVDHVATIKLHYSASGSAIWMSVKCQQRTSKPVGVMSAIPPIPAFIFAPMADARNLVAAKKIRFTAL
jgi:hypothetical protein